jgi:hypothetical protein
MVTIQVKRETVLGQENVEAEGRVLVGKSGGSRNSCARNM